jgi:hypothetical protein
MSKKKKKNLSYFKDGGLVGGRKKVGQKRKPFSFGCQKKNIFHTKSSQFNTYGSQMKYRGENQIEQRTHNKHRCCLVVKWYFVDTKRQKLFPLYATPFTRATKIPPIPSLHKIRNSQKKQ